MPQIQVNDADLHYDEFGTGEPLLIIHGMMETGRTYARVALSLCDQYRVIVPDLRGYGQSRPRPRTFPSDFYARDARDMIGLLQQLGCTGVRILGVADGGEVALVMAAMEPDLVQAMVVLSVCGALPQSLGAVLPNIGSWLTDPNASQLAFKNEATRDYGVEGTKALYDGWKTAARAIMAAGGNISLAQAGTIRCPVLIINGSEDQLNTPELSRTLAAAIPRAELEFVADAGQLVLEKHRRGFGERVLTWFAAH